MVQVHCISFKQRMHSSVNLSNNVSIRDLVAHAIVINAKTEIKQCIFIGIYKLYEGN